MAQGATWLTKHGGADGIWGKATQKAFADFNCRFYNWPTEKQLDRFYGKPDLSTKTHPNITYITPAYPMYLAWQPSTKLNRIAVHEKCADSLEWILHDILDFYGLDRVKHYGLDQFGGTLNVRNKRGGNTLSTHAYGAAIDLDPVRNQLKWGKDKSYIARHCPDLEHIFGAYGWGSLGFKYGYDFMHFEAVKL